MRILHLVVGGGWGSAERLACALARGAEAQGHTVAVEATPYCVEAVAQQGLTVLSPKTAAAKAPLGENGNTPLLFRWALATRKSTQAFAPDIVHVHLSSPAFGATAAYAVGNHPSLWTFHTLPEKDWPKDFLLRLPTNALLRWAARKETRVFVGVSRADTATLEGRFPRAKLRCIVNAPPPDASETEEGPIDRARFGHAEHTLLFVGPLDADRGLDRLLSALATPPLRQLSCHLLVIGDGPDRTQLEDQSATLGLTERVTFLGAMSTRSAVRAADVVISTSRHEAMPLLPMQVVLLGVPMLASRITPHCELFAQVPHSLLPADDASWSSWLSAWLSDPARRSELVTDQAALRSYFSFDRVLGEYLTLYDETRHRPAPPHEP